MNSDPFFLLKPFRVVCLSSSETVGRRFSAAGTQAPTEVPLWGRLNVVLIHVPRTGGTTVRGILHEIAVHYGLQDTGRRSSDTDPKAMFVYFSVLFPEAITVEISKGNMNPRRHTHKQQTLSGGTLLFLNINLRKLSWI